MNLTEPGVAHRVLLVDDDAAVRAMMNQGLERKGFEVVAAASVTEALKRIATESFDVLITDLHMPDPGDGFTVVSAMRHSQPDALTMLVSGYPDVQSAMAAILLEADEIVVKPFEIGRLTELVRERVINRKPTRRLEKERVGVILQRCVSSIVEDWLARAKQSTDLNCLPLSDEERTGHLPKLVEDLAVRLSKPNATHLDSDAHLFRRRRSSWQAAVSARLHSCNAGARIANPTGDYFRDIAAQSEFFGFQFAVARCHDYRGRGGRAVDAIDGQLHETHAEVSGSVATATISCEARICVTSGAVYEDNVIGGPDLGCAWYRILGRAHSAH
jgi:DNA-binding response OmpR family regulator